MNTKTKNLIFFLLIFLWGMEATFAFTPSTEQLITLWSGALQNYTAPSSNQSPRSKQQIVNMFCQQSLSTPLNTAFNDSFERYPPQQSLFLALLCSQTTNQLPNFHSTILLNSDNSYLKKETSLKKLQYDKKCTDPELKYQEECNLSSLSKNIITDIITDLTILKQANLYGISNFNLTNEKELKYDIALFAEKYLKLGKANDEENNFCTGKARNYPTTCNYAIKNIKTFKKPLQNLTLIDIQKLLKDSKTKNQNEKLCIKNPQKPDAFDSLYCNIFYPNTKEQGLAPFTNQVYNELLRYSLFSSYYRYNLQLRNETTLSTQQEIQSLSKTPQTIISATNQTLKELAEIQSSYPYHIGMLAYQEDLLKLRTRLSTLVTPFYTLFYKLQNVQIPN